MLGGSIRRPHARTRHRLAAGLGVPADELFQNPSVLAHRLFDRQTNPRGGRGHGQPSGAFRGLARRRLRRAVQPLRGRRRADRRRRLRTVEGMNRRRDLHRKVAIVLESHEAELLEQMIDTLYRRVVIVSPEEPGDAGADHDARTRSGPRWQRPSVWRTSGSRVRIATWGTFQRARADSAKLSVSRNGARYRGTLKTCPTCPCDIVALVAALALLGNMLARLADVSAADRPR